MADLFEKQQKEIKLSNEVIEIHFLQLMAWHMDPMPALTTISILEQLGLSTVVEKNAKLSCRR